MRASLNGLTILSPVPFGAAKSDERKSYHCSDTASQTIEATAFLALDALYMAWQVLARLSQHAAAVKCHLAVLRRPSAMPEAHLPAEKGPVCAPYKEGGPKSRPTRSLRGSARKPTSQEVGAPPPPHNAGASGSIYSTSPIFNFRWGRFLGGCVCWRRGRPHGHMGWMEG